MTKTRLKPEPTSIKGEETKPTLLDKLARFERFWRDIAGVVLLALALMTAIGLFFPGITGGLLRWWVDQIRIWLGWGALWLVPGFGLSGYRLLCHQPEYTQGENQFWTRLFMIELAAFISLALLSLFGEHDLTRAEAGLDGGRVGWGLAEIFRRLLAPFGLSSQIVLIALLSIIFLLAFFSGMRWITALRRWSASTMPPKRFVEDAPIVSEAPLSGSDMVISTTIAPAAARRKLSLPPQFRKSFRVEEETKTSTQPPERDGRLPPLDLLVNEQFTRPDERNINLTAGLIEKTLAEFGIPAKVVGFRVGPTITQFAVEPGYLEKDKPNGENGDAARQKVRVAQIAALSRDLTLALSADRLRIEAPVPGRPYVGIEVPNARSSIVRLRPLMESEQFYKISSPLAIAIGRDVSGSPYVTDLVKMPHLLIAGTTGSGKSVCIAALTTCLVVNNTPEDLRLVMVDPKMVELVRFNGLPHLYGKVETQIERILGVLRWTVTEMDRRYKVLEASHSRNLDSYNRKIRKRKGERPLPHIVVMIDELADLMMSAPEQTEHNLVRLAQMARATGIHLVVATQRPGTDVVTGLIKANFPARAAFSVASSVDSRVILDTGGAESLLGHGDMLFLPPEASGPIRLQGVMVSDQEVERAITFWQKTWVEPHAEDESTPPWEQAIAQEMLMADRDGLVEKAIEIVRKGRHASASLLQRRLHIGYPRAARLIDELEELGVIGPAVSGGRERDVLLDESDEYDQSDD